MQFIDHRRGSAAEYSWVPPFDWSVAYAQGHWWDAPRIHAKDPWFIQVLAAGVEVGRVEIDDPGTISTEYQGIPPVRSERLEIQLIEVATVARGRGIGTRIVRELEARFPERRLFAYSQGADGFWDSLGWKPFYRPSRPPARTLFIQPAR
ncbi:acetyltransferase, gnat family protein [Mycobacteroides abscessus subsp. abscessus]|nr:acetyltransferase, gnat family protein [Mycobacteroides abscessus subsp. abscessus]